MHLNFLSPQLNQVSVREEARPTIKFVEPNTK